MSIADVKDGSCEFPHVQPFSLDLHIFGMQCKQNVGALIGVLFVTILIKLGQNYMYTKMAQLQRELLQIDKSARSYTTPKVLELIAWEFVAGVVGIVSVLVITGNNAIVWLTIIFANCAGTWYAYTHVEADHHSTALEIVNMLHKREENNDEGVRVRSAIRELRKALADEDLEEIDKVEDVNSNLLRKRLFL